MHITKNLIISVLLIILLSFFYYQFFVWNERILSSYCQKHICFDILSLSEFLALLTAWISLYFVLKSLTSWKEHYKFERAFTAIQKINELNLLTNRYQVFLNQLSNQLQQYKENELEGSFDFEQQEFEQNIAQLNIHYHQIEISHWLSQNKNIKYFGDFQNLLNEVSYMISDIETSIYNANLSEPNYGSQYATDSDIARRIESINKIKIANKQFNIRKQAFQKNFLKLHNKLNKS